MTPEDVARDLMRRGCRLYHAINLPDFRTYVRVGALLSRRQLSLTDSGVGTAFTSDGSDAARGLDDRCFGNLADFGASFWRFKTAPPNAYGPITLVFRPDVFRIALDAALTNKNAAKDDYDLTKDRITDPAQWSAVFADPNGSRLAKGHFFAEFSTSTNVLPFEFLEEIVVEPITFADVELTDIVKDVAPSLTVTARNAAPLQEKQQVLDGLVEWCADRGGTPPGPMDLDSDPFGVGSWWKDASPSTVAYQWFKYLVSTLKDMDAGAVKTPAAEPPICDECDRRARVKCFGCGRYLCYDDYTGADANGRHDVENQRRCWRCCFDET